MDRAALRAERPGGCLAMALAGIPGGLLLLLLAAGIIGGEIMLDYRCVRACACAGLAASDRAAFQPGGCACLDVRGGRVPVGEALAGTFPPARGERDP